MTAVTNAMLIAGLGCLAASGFLVHPALGLAMSGFGLLAVSVLMFMASE